MIPTISLTWDTETIISVLQDPNGPGFFYLQDHGVPQSIFDSALHQSHLFHALSPAEKNEISAFNNGYAYASGYSRPGTQGAYTKDPVSDVRNDTEKESLAINTRGSLVFRFPQENEVLDQPYLQEPYADFLQMLPDDYRSIHPSPTVVGDAARNFFAPNQWPDPNKLPEFRIVVEDYISAMRTVASDMFALFTTALQNERGTKPIPREVGMTTMNFAHYGAIKGGGNDEGGPTAFGIGDHTDWEVFTLLYPAYYPRYERNPHVDTITGKAYTGLEIWFQDKWVSVPHKPGTVIVNQGEMLSRLSGGRFKAAVHRVDATRDFDRHSLVSFWAPNYDVMLPDPTQPCGHVLCGEYYLQRNGFLPKCAQPHT